MLLGIETQIINGTVHQTINFDEPSTISVISIVVAISTALLLWYQIRKQTKIDSARIIIDYIDKLLEKNKEVTDIIYDREKDNSIKFKSDKSVRVLLSQLEDIIQFTNDKIIQKTHVLNTLEILLGTIKKDSEIQRIIKEAQDKNKTAFVLLSKFLKDDIT